MSKLNKPQCISAAVCLLASLMLLCFSLVGFWVAFMGSANTPLMVKVLVGSGSLMCLMLSLVALKEKSQDK